MSLGMAEALVVLGIVLLLFGGKKIPELGRAIGQSLKNFKRGLEEEPSEDSSEKPRKGD